MPYLPDAVPESALDHGEILRRGGANHGDEDFALCRCPRCSRVYLVEYEVDTVFLDASDLAKRVPAHGGFKCECGNAFPPAPWVGPDAPADMQVTWADIKANSWRWTCESAIADQESAGSGTSQREAMAKAAPDNESTRRCNPLTFATAGCILAGLLLLVFRLNGGVRLGMRTTLVLVAVGGLVGLVVRELVCRLGRRS